MRPDFLSSIVDLACKLHVDAPVIRIPSDLPVEVEATENLQSHVQPEAGGANARSPRIPSTLLDQGSGTCNMVHTLQGSFAHDFVNIEYDSCRGADDGISVRVLQVLQEISRSGIVIMERFLFTVGRIDQD